MANLKHEISGPGKEITQLYHTPAPVVQWQASGGEGRWARSPRAPSHGDRPQDGFHEASLIIEKPDLCYNLRLHRFAGVPVCKAHIALSSRFGSPPWYCAWEETSSMKLTVSQEGGR